MSAPLLPADTSGTGRPAGGSARGDPPLPGLASREPLPLGLEDLDAVMDIEPLAYPFPWSRGNVRDSLAGGHRARGLRDDDGRLVAYAFAMPGVGEWHLLNLTVRPECQGEGLGRRLLDDLVDAARSDGSAWVWLEVRVSNTRAQHLYGRQGFEAVGLRKGYYPAGPGRREDAVVMRRSLR